MCLLKLVHIRRRLQVRGNEEALFLAIVGDVVGIAIGEEVKGSGKGWQIGAGAPHGRTVGGTRVVHGGSRLPR